MQCSSMKLVKNNNVVLTMLVIITDIIRGFKYFGLELDDTMQNKVFFLYILLVDIYVAKTTFGLLPLEVLSA